MPGQNEARYRIPETVLFRELDEESVLLDLTSESYFGLDEVGTRMWLAVTGTDSLQNARARLLQEYDVAPDTLERDLADWVEELTGKGLLIRETVDADGTPDA